MQHFSLKLTSDMNLKTKKMRPSAQKGATIPRGNLPGQHVLSCSAAPSPPEPSRKATSNSRGKRSQIRFGKMLYSCDVENCEKLGGWWTSFMMVSWDDLLVKKSWWNFQWCLEDCKRFKVGVPRFWGLDSLKMAASCEVFCYVQPVLLFMAIWRPPRAHNSCKLPEPSKYLVRP